MKSLAQTFVPAIVLFTCTAVRGAAEQPPPLFALCHDTHDAKKRSLAQQAEMLAELGYDGAGHLWFGGMEECLKTLDEHELKLFQICECLNLADSPIYDEQRFEQLLPLIKGRGVQIALPVSGGEPSDSSLDEKTVTVLREMADKAAPVGVSIVLYPHRGNWVETVDDGLRVVEKVDRENVGTMFNLCRWAMVDEEKNLAR
jgi:sugar phosphate isomerase/epimerase